jgi:phosphate acetyltransferase
MSTRRCTFDHPVRVGDTVTVTITCEKKFPRNHHMIFDCVCTNQDGQKVITGTAEVLAPTEKVKRPKANLPDFKLSETRKARFEHLLEITRGLSPVSMAVAHPCDAESLKGALLARDRGLIVPTLVGPEEKIRQIAEANALDLARLHLINVAHSHAAAEVAVRWPAKARSKPDEGLAAYRRIDGEVIDKSTGLRTERRISHVFVMDVPTYPRRCSSPTRRSMSRRTWKTRSTSCRTRSTWRMHAGQDRRSQGGDPRRGGDGQPQDAGHARRRRAVQDGRPRPDRRRPARRPAGLRQRHLAGRRAHQGHQVSPVAGQADILLVPDIESGNMLAKQLEYLADALTRRHRARRPRAHRAHQPCRLRRDAHRLHRRGRGHGPRQTQESLTPWPTPS